MTEERKPKFNSGDIVFIPKFGAKEYKIIDSLAYYYSLQYCPYKYRVVEVYTSNAKVEMNIDEYEIFTKKTDPNFLLQTIEILQEKIRLLEEKQSKKKRGWF